jgi:hypothetical protein
LPEIDEQSFALGKQVGEIKAWCEAARSGAKDIFPQRALQARGLRRAHPPYGGAGGAQ